MKKYYPTNSKLSMQNFNNHYKTDIVKALGLDADTRSKIAVYEYQARESIYQKEKALSQQNSEMVYNGLIPKYGVALGNSVQELQLIPKNDYTNQAKVIEQICKTQREMINMLSHNLQTQFFTLEDRLKLQSDIQLQSNQLSKNQESLEKVQADALLQQLQQENVIQNINENQVGQNQENVVDNNPQLNNNVEIVGNNLNGGE